MLTVTYLSAFDENMQSLPDAIVSLRGRLSDVSRGFPSGFNGFRVSDAFGQLGHAHQSGSFGDAFQQFGFFLQLFLSHRLFAIFRSLLQFRVLIKQTAGEKVVMYERSLSQTILALTVKRVHNF